MTKRALIIENEYDTDYTIKAFLKDNAILFNDINIQLYCKHRKLEDIGRFINDTDCIIIATTWLYLDQIEEYIDAFLYGPFKNKNIDFYVYNFLDDLNKWKNYMPDLINIRNKIIKLVKSGKKIYSFNENYASNEIIVDEHNFFNEEHNERKPFISYEISYDINKDEFYKI